MYIFMTAPIPRESYDSSNSKGVMSHLTKRSLFNTTRYGVATISRMLKNIGLFCKRDLQKRPIFCKETYIFKHPTHRSHPIVNTQWYAKTKCLRKTKLAYLYIKQGASAKRSLEVT